MEEKISRLQTNLKDRVKHKGWREAISHGFYQILVNGIPRHILGQEIFSPFKLFEEDWEILIILDGCRVDALRDTISQSQIDAEKFESRTSPGGKSLDWMREIFSERNKSYLSDCSYITANPHSEIIFNESTTIDSGELQNLDEVWRDEWDQDVGTVRAESVTNKSIDQIRDRNADKYIIHYMQPHFPSIPQPDLGSGISKNEIGNEWSESVWKRLEYGDIAEDKVWDAYIENLSYALNSVSKLLKNIDSDSVAISADHGNAFGEWGFYGHTAAPVSTVRKVPWVKTSAKNTENYDPNKTKVENETDISVEDRLESLGYK